jgi:2-haloacid dehalogenase
MCSARPLGPLTALCRDKQLQYTWLRATQGRHADFWQVTGDALDFTLETLGRVGPGLRDRLMRLYLRLDPFPGVPAVQELRSAGFETAILSNGTSAMLTAASDNAGLAGLLDQVLSVEMVGVYKPPPKVYQLACDRLGLTANAIVFLSSNAWDANAAAALGTRVVWCSRYGQNRERLPGSPRPRDPLIGRAAPADCRARRLISPAPGFRSIASPLRPHRLEA